MFEMTINLFIYKKIKIKNKNTVSYCDFIKNYTLEFQQNHIVSQEDNLVDKLKNAKGILRGGGFKFLKPTYAYKNQSHVPNFFKLIKFQTPVKCTF